MIVVGHMTKEYRIFRLEHLKGRDLFGDTAAWNLCPFKKTSILRNRK